MTDAFRPSTESRLRLIQKLHKGIRERGQSIEQSRL